MRHWPTSQLVNIRERYYLVDCGEGTQIQLRRYRVKFQRIDRIFISHLHGDHIFGLVGLMSSMHLLGRETDLHLYGPPELEELLKLQLRVSSTFLRYKFVFHPLNFGSPEVIFEDDTLSITTIPLHHGMPCNGFLFREKPKPRNLIKEQLKRYEIPVVAMPGIKAGADFETEDGKIIPNDALASPPKKSYSYAFCSDTAFKPALAEQLKGVDLLYHEATFTKEMAGRAEVTFHSTAEQAATLAQEAEVGQLVIGHFSARYKDDGGHLTEAQAVFSNTVLATEGAQFRLY